MVPQANNECIKTAFCEGGVCKKRKNVRCDPRLNECAKNLACLTEDHFGRPLKSGVPQCVWPGLNLKPVAVNTYGKK